MRETDGRRTDAVRLKPDPTYRGRPDPTYDAPPDPSYGEPPDTRYAEPPLFASSIEQLPRRRGGLSIWFAAAGSLVLGIVIGFGSGYRAGQGTNLAAPPAEPGAANPAPTSGASSPGQTFSESDVSDPVRLNPAPAQPAPKPAPAPRGTAPARRQTPPPAASEQKASAQSVPDRPVLTGPGSLEVVSRPAGAQVILDGRVVGKTPLTIADVAAGSHSIRLELPGFNGWATMVDVRAGSPIRVAASLEQ